MLQTISNYFEILLNTISDTFESIGNLFSGITQGLVTVQNLTWLMPSFLMPIILCVIGAAVLKLVVSLGRN